MEQKTVAFCTLGCKVNQYETNAMMQKMLEAGYTIKEFNEKADIYIINTCTVTNMADKKSRQMLRRVKEINPKPLLVAVGCYAQVAKEQLSKIEEIDLILGVNEKKDIVFYINQALSNNEKSVKHKIINAQDVSKSQNFSDFGTITHSENTRAIIKVQDGCNQFCSYCIIPYARGRIRSRKPENVLQEIKAIIGQGVKEVVITGIHIASYGKDFSKPYYLIDLLEEIHKIDGIQRIRLGSLEPTLITPEFTKRLAKLPKICNQFHLSLQSGCNETLKRMNRKYTVEEFQNAITLLQNAFPETHFTTDIIVGFPGETSQEFEQTYNFLSNIPFYKMHIFPYSPRKGTVAASMPNQVDGNEKEKRSQKLINLSNQKENNYLKNEIGKTIEVLWEEEKNGYYQGHTKNYMLVKTKSSKNLQNTITKVTVTSVENLSLIAK